MKKKSILILILLLFGIAIYAYNQASARSITKHYVVKLYSAGNTVATWEALDLGQVDGQTAIFTVGDDLIRRQVRISGTFSIEETE